MGLAFRDETRDTTNKTSKEAGSATDTRLHAMATSADSSMEYPGSAQFPGQAPLDTRGTDS